MPGLDKTDFDKTGLDPETAALLGAAVAKHVARAADGRASRARRGALPGYAAAELATMADQGWLAVAIPEAEGGLGLGLAGAAIIAEGLAGCFSADPLHGLFLAARTLVHAGAGEGILAEVASGAARPALAWQEEPAQFRAPERCATRLSPAGAITGRKAFVAGAAGASGFIVSAAGPRGLALLLVAAEAPGLDLAQDFRADGTPLGRLTLTEAPGRLLAEGDRAEAALRAALDETSLLVAAELMGHIDRMMALKLDHLRTRRQFDRPIGAFQALQHRAADAFLRQRLARSVLGAALARIGAGPDPAARGMLAARARARLNDTAHHVMRESIQLFGAMGVTDENDLALHVKRCLSLTGWLGGSVEQRGYYMDLAAPRTRPGHCLREDLS